MAWVQNSNLAYNGQNYTYDVYRQNLPNDCTVSCMIMLVKYVLDRNLAQGIAQLWIRQSQQLGDADIIRYANGLPLQRPAVHNNAWRWGGGRGGASVGEVFYSLRRNLPQHRWLWMMPGPGSAAIPLQLASCTPQRPAIVSIDWNHNGGKHVALCLGKRPFRPEIVFLDPYHGVVACPYAPLANWLQYDTQQSSFGLGGSQGLIDEALFS
ncbi:hypothetical protein [Microbulbifer litoralis]|uniref:hypothetical protein n=1 Tax=Microbulbifer litoralis TaxID=2933965 RepID=UPI0020283801|nr:hypothetical protein [Microbulbifer sp. GX H0434]